MNQRKKPELLCQTLYRCISASLAVVLGTGEDTINEFIALVVDFNDPIDAITPEKLVAIWIHARDDLAKVRSSACRY